MKEISFEIPDRDERGVSPVIGVILMVAITVILAAVIASFVLGFGDQVGESVQAGADISQTNDGNASVTWIDQGNADTLNVSVSNETETINIDDAATNTTDLGEVGNTVKITAPSANDVDVTITVTAVRSGSRTVVTQEEMTLSRSS